MNEFEFSEMARLFGIDFYSVLSRGSQYRVEAVLLRVSKSLGYFLLSPSRAQVAAQAPMECIPLVMEPLSGFYPDPVVRFLLFHLVLLQIVLNSLLPLEVLVFLLIC